MSSDDRIGNWVADAEADLAAADLLIKGGYFSSAVFHCQQAAEKAMKALALHCHKRPWGHSVWNLYLEAADSLGVEDVEAEKAARQLDFHYIASRYPDAFPSGTAAEHYDRDDAKEASAWAKTVFMFAKKHI